MTTPLTELVAEPIFWYSKLDEECFFVWLKKIEAVRNVFGEGRVIIIQCAPPPIDDKSLRELTALFVRYGIKTEQLDAYLCDANRSWFADENTFWRQAKDR
jgi:hypothetical protein